MLGRLHTAFSSLARSHSASYDCGLGGACESLADRRGLRGAAGWEEVGGDLAHELDRLTAREARQELCALAVEVAGNERRLDTQRGEGLGDDLGRLHDVWPRTLQLGRL